VANLARGRDGFLYMGISRETLASVVVNALSDGRTSEKHIALLRSATTPDEWRTAEEMVAFGQELAANA